MNKRIILGILVPTIAIITIVLLVTLGKDLDLDVDTVDSINEKDLFAPYTENPIILQTIIIKNSGGLSQKYHHPNLALCLEPEGSSLEYLGMVRSQSIDIFGGKEKEIKIENQPSYKKPNMNQKYTKLIIIEGKGDHIPNCEDESGEKYEIDIIRDCEVIIIGNSSIKGSVLYKGEIIEDNCLNEDAVTKYSCVWTGNNWNFSKIDLSCSSYYNKNKCVDGTCIFDTSAEKRIKDYGDCEDTDDGIDYYERGEIEYFYNNETWTTEDNCWNPDQVREFYCESRIESEEGHEDLEIPFSTSYYICPSGVCENGECTIPT